MVFDLNYNFNHSKNSMSLIIRFTIQYSKKALLIEIKPQVAKALFDENILIASVAV